MDIAMIWDKVFGTSSAIVSKSDAHRALIAAALADKPTNFNLSNVSLDIEATMNCLLALGAKILKAENNLTVYPISQKAVSPVLNCNESGSTLRFMIPTASVVSENPSFIGQGRLSQRPLTPLAIAMERQGCDFSREALPLTVSGELKPGIFSLPGNISSQFISGLLFALPLLSGSSEIILTTPLESSAYVDMTIDTLNRFKIEIQKTDNGFFIPGNQKYLSPLNYTVEGDWSNAAPFMVAAALGGELKIDNLAPNSKQSDTSILSILEMFGADITYKNSSYLIRKKNANPFNIDMSGCPDLFPVAAVLACGAMGKSCLYNASRLRLKESDRIQSTMALIDSLGGKCVADSDSLTIMGSGRLIGGKCDSFNDHRIVMAAAVASAICHDSVIISGAEAINKSFPDFIKYFEETGGLCRVI